MTLKVFGGPQASIPTLADRRPGFTTDTFRLYIGWGGTNRLVGTTDHTALSNLGWGASGHIGTANRLAAFDGSGNATYAAIGIEVQAYHANLAAIAAGTWTGATSITTLGTIATGTWQGTAIAAAYLGAHASRHQSGGADPIKLDDLAAPDDNTDLNASTSAHGLLRKLSNVSTEFLNGLGNWATPASSLNITGLTAADPAAADEVPIYDASAAANRKATVDQIGGLLLSGVSGLRLTLTSGTPVTTSDVTAAGTVYATFCTGNQITLYDGTRDKVYLLSAELSCTLSDTTKSPAAVTSGNNYDLFVWEDSGTVRLSRGPAWSSSTSRGTGAGTTELEYRSGRLVNKQAITNGPAAQRGTYVGTFRGTGTSTTEDSAAQRFLWNMYNRVPRKLLTVDATSSWSYASTTWRQVRATATNQVEVVLGLAGEPVWLNHFGMADNGSGRGFIGIGKDRTNGNDAELVNFGSPVGGAFALFGLLLDAPALGYHYYARVEACSSASSVAFYGQALTKDQSGMHGIMLG